MADVRTMLARGLVTAEELHDGFEAMQASLFRFPAVGPGRFGGRLTDAAGPRER